MVVLKVSCCGISPILARRTPISGPAGVSARHGDCVVGPVLALVDVHVLLVLGSGLR